MMIQRISDTHCLVGQEVADGYAAATGADGVTDSAPLSDWLRTEGLRSLCEQLRHAKAGRHKAAVIALYKQIKLWMYGVGYWDVPALCFVQMVHEPYVHCGNCNNVMTYSSKAEVVFYEHA